MPGDVSRAQELGARRRNQLHKEKQRNEERAGSPGLASASGEMICGSQEPYKPNTNLHLLLWKKQL